MSSEIAFVGDVHGNRPALSGLWRALVRRETSHVIFLGDYINKGSQSAGVMQDLIAHRRAGRASLLAGNHELALLDAIDRQDLSGFLKMGGAMTVKSYVGRRVGPDVFADFIAAFPPEHLAELRAMRTAYETDELIAEHIPSNSPTAKFHISAHIPVGELPRIGSRTARVDTGCGTDSGRLTALLWPSLDYMQVNSQGEVVP
ncbi:metallophosphoesterase [Nocardioides deserti]|uniref:Metallophosphoesterase n=1 Tax=Nocardioides deserti TaxID=1588644 RepID=A0ABR6U530_9ACTN|nr:metallophosphoesterase [Nocardioides deserti]GGO68375.1 serine/threonine protein phosphatase [Nocardioides deserti]